MTSAGPRKRNRTACRTNHHATMLQRTEPSCITLHNRTYTGRRRRAAAGVRGGCAKFSSSAHPMTRLSSSPFGFPPPAASQMQLNAPPCGAWQRRACVPSPVLEARCPVETWHAGLGLGATRPETIRLFFIPNPRRQRPVSRSGATTTSGQRQRSAKLLIFPPDGWRLCT